MSRLSAIAPAGSPGAPSSLYQQLRAALRWLVLGMSRTELVLVTLLLVYVLPFINVLGSVTSIAKKLRWPLLGLALIWLVVTPKRRVFGGRVPLPATLVALWLFWGGISTFASSTPVVSFLKYAANALTVAGLFAAATRIVKPDGWVRIMAFTCLLMGILTVPSAFWGESIADEYYRTEGYIEAGPNAVGILAIISLSLTLPFGTWLWLTRRKPAAMAMAAAMFCVGVVLLATGSRASAGGAAIGVVIWLFTFRGRQARHLPLIASVAIVGAAILSMSDFGKSQLDYMTRERGVSIQSFESRAQVWQDSIDSWRKRPLLGYGFGTCGRGVDLKTVSYQAFTLRDGSGYFGMLESIGLPGLLLFVAYLASQVLCFQRLVRMPENSLIRAGGLAAVVCQGALAFNHLGEPWLLGPGSPICLIFWMCGAGTVALAYGKGQEQTPATIANTDGLLPNRVRERLERNRRLAQQRPALQAVPSQT